MANLTIKIGFGRVNIPHKGHLFIISKCNLFILSDSKGLIPIELRIKALKLLGCDTSKIIIGNPYNTLKLFEGMNDILIVSSQENVSLANRMKLPIQLIERIGDFSSTNIRNLIKANRINELKIKYGFDENYIELIKTKLM
jgi:hypothetical protein